MMTSVRKEVERKRFYFSCSINSSPYSTVPVNFASHLAWLMQRETEEGAWRRPLIWQSLDCRRSSTQPPKKSTRSSSMYQRSPLGPRPNFGGSIIMPSYFTTANFTGNKWFGIIADPADRRHSGHWRPDFLLPILWLFRGIQMGDLCTNFGGSKRAAPVWAKRLRILSGLVGF